MLQKTGLTLESSQKLYFESMNDMRKQAIFVLVMLLDPVVGYAQDVPINVSIKAEHARYTAGESIVVSLVVVPERNEVIEFREDFFVKLRDKFEVLNPRGEKLISTSEVIYRPASPYRWFEASKEKPYVYSIDLAKDVFIPSSHRPFPTGLELVGSYSVRYLSHTAVRYPERKDDAVWEGEARSNVLQLNIVAPTTQEFEEAIDTLSTQGASETEKIRAVKKIEHLSSGRKVDVYSTALKDQSKAVRTAAIRAIGDTKSQEAFLALKGRLDERDPFVRAEIIAAIGKFRSPEAISLLVDEVKSKHERSYRAAVVLLGDIGDETALPVLTEVAESDSTDWVRERARESIKKILASSPRREGNLK